MSFPYSIRTPSVNVQNPFDDEIPNGLQPGKQITIRGGVPHGSPMFRVDLVNFNNQIALHINPRFQIGQIVRNTNSAGWGPEERHGPFPFRHGENFELVITTEADHFVVAANGSHLFDYHHRLPFGEITRLQISGGVEIYEVFFYGGVPALRAEAQHVSVPGTIPLVGKLVQIIGSVPPGAGRFEIDLQNGSGVQPLDIPLHFNPRWNDPYSASPIVIRTNRHGGGWGPEDRAHDAFPFEQGGTFEIFIQNDTDEWKVAVNGNHFISFPHRADPATVDHIGFAGDVNIQCVRQF